MCVGVHAGVCVGCVAQTCMCTRLMFVHVCVDMQCMVCMGEGVGLCLCVGVCVYVWVDMR